MIGCNDLILGSSEVGSIQLLISTHADGGPRSLCLHMLNTVACPPLDMSGEREKKQGLRQDSETVKEFKPVEIYLEVS